MPNLITLGRVILIPFVATFILDAEFVAAFWLFVLAGVSDGVDGFIAKRYDAVTKIGTYLDPIADKALLISVYVTLAIMGAVPNWLVVLVISRDVAIIGAIMLSQALEMPINVKPHFVSKINTAVQILYAAYLLATLSYSVPDGEMVRYGTYAVGATTLFSWLVYLSGWITVISTWEDAEKSDT